MVRAVIVAIAFVVALSSFCVGRDNATEVAPPQRTSQLVVSFDQLIVRVPPA